MDNWRCSHGWLRGEQCEICNAPKREWVGLTDDDWAAIEDMPDTFDQGVAWAAARLKEKNT